MYARAMILAVARMKRVTADLLVVTVMIATFLAGKPLGGALVAWFISLGTCRIPCHCRKNASARIDALARETARSVRVIRDDELQILSVEKILPGDIAIVPQG